MASKTPFLSDEVYDYLLSISCREHQALKDLRKASMSLHASYIAISPEQGQFLQMLVKLTGAKRILEIGMFAGYSACAMALALPEEGSLTTCELTPVHEPLARKHWSQAGVNEKISVIPGDAKESLSQMISNNEAPFDFIFLDADKRSYGDYYELCLQLVKPGGLIAIDNVLWVGKLVQYDDGSEPLKVVREMNAKIHQDERVDVSTIPVGGGLSLVRRRSSASAGV